MNPENEKQTEVHRMERNQKLILWYYLVYSNIVIYFSL